MGSDNRDGPSRRICTHASLRVYHNRIHLIYFLLGVPPLLAAIVAAVLLLPPPEIVLADSFASNTYHRLPAQCEKAAADFHRCQATSDHTLVFACHRKWCNGWGHCEPCMGLGDRSRFLLSGITEAVKHCVHIQLDYPVLDIALLQSAIYRDPAGWWGELFHFRSYQLADPHKHLKLTLPPSDKMTVSHFTSNFLTRNYDACLFHILFRPTVSLSNDLDRHNAAIGTSSIGIHFRTGDFAAFSLNQTHDLRIGQDQTLDAAIAAMLQCADRLATKLFPYRQAEQVTFYLATDSSVVKDMIVKNASAWSQHPIYMTSVQPQAYLRALSGDRDAWMEMYLLAARQGLVANALPADYDGPVSYAVSMFAQLAQKIGFITDDKFVACSLDTDKEKKL
jgi:hypothetical protein